MRAQGLPASRRKRRERSRYKLARLIRLSFAYLVFAEEGQVEDDLEGLSVCSEHH